MNGKGGFDFVMEREFRTRKIMNIIYAVKMELSLSRGFVSIWSEEKLWSRGGGARIVQ